MNRSETRDHMGRTSFVVEPLLHPVRSRAEEPADSILIQKVRMFLALSDLAPEIVI
jgi:hypothetical protein